METIEMYTVLASVLAGGIALIGRYNDLDRIEHEREMREITLKMQKRVAKWLHIP
jgi:hypothetical protein